MSDPSSFSSRDAALLRERLTAAVEGNRRRFKVAGVAVVVLVVAGGWAFNNVLQPAPNVDTVVASLPRVGADSAPEAKGDTPNAAVAPGTNELTAADVFVQVSGAVQKPGVYALPASSRANDAVALAGGLTADADVDRVNLAAKVTDGQQIFVARKGEPPPINVSSGSTGINASGPRGPVNLNRATQAELEELPGVGPALARAILDYREQQGSFKSVQDLNEVKGIGDAKFADLKDKVAV